MWSFANVFYICGIEGEWLAIFWETILNFFEKSFGVKPTTNSMYGAAQKYSGFQTVTAP